MSYFPNGVHYMPGGIETGFTKVVRKTDPVLMQVKGDRYPRVFQVPLEAKSVNEGDIFILQVPSKDEDGFADIYYWPGKEANMYEKGKAVMIAKAIDTDEYKTKANMRYPRDEEGGDLDNAFWGFLGGKPAQINPAVSDDVDQEDIEEMTNNFYHVSNDTGKLLCTLVTERPLKHAHLQTGDCYILELHKHIYLWIGKEAHVDEKKAAL